MPADVTSSTVSRRQRLVQRRKALGLTQEALAELVAVGRSTVVRWERGESEPLPSIRALAAELLVSLITVKRAYEELEREGILFRRQGLGTFIAEAGAEQTRSMKRETARAALRQAVTAGREGGLSDKDIMDWLKKEL